MYDSRFNIYNFRHDPRVLRWVDRLRDQPSWVWKLAGGAALLVVVVPILTLALTAVAAFAAVFAALYLARRLGGWLGDRLGWSGSRRRTPPDRRSVHVIRISD